PFFASGEVEMDVNTLTDGEVYDGYPNRTFYFASSSFAEEHPEHLDLILEAIDEADQWANENKSEVVEIMSEALGISEEVIHHKFEQHTFCDTKITPESVETQKKQAYKYAGIDLIPEKIDVSEKIYEMIE